MKLIDAVIMGRFCGLKTVKEAIANIDLHYWYLVPYSEISEARKSFYKEVQAYEAGELILDEELIEKELKKLDDDLAACNQRLDDEERLAKLKIH